MQRTENFNLIVTEGSDIVNLLTQVNPNTEVIDEQMFKNQNAGVQTATELVSGTVHAITRSIPNASMIRFTAVSRFTAGDTFTVDGVQVSALLPSGEQLPDGAYIIGSEVLCVLKGTLLTVFVSGGAVTLARNAEKLGGQLPSYYATKEEAEVNKQNIAKLNTAKANYQGNDDVSLVCNDSHMQVTNKANNGYRPVYASDFLFNGNFSLREHTPYAVESIIVSCTNGESNINFSTLGISSRPSVVMAQLQSDQGFISYNYDNSNSYVNLNIFTRKKDSSGIVSEEGIVPAPTGTYRIGVIVYK